jgi:hypothetical protein
MSASLWYKHPSSISATQYLISRYTTTATAGGYKVYMNSTGVVCFGIDDDSTWNPDDEVCDSNSTADSNWHQVEAVKSEGSQSITLYIDGKQVSQKTSLSATGSLSGNSPTFYVGIDADGTSSPWNGFIDQVKIYNFARTSDQAKTDFINIGSVDTVSASIGSPDPYASLNQGLVGYWKMDDGVGNPCTAGVDKACDSSGNGNTGTWTSGVASTSGKFGYGTNYDGVDDLVTLPDIMPTGAYTKTAWVKASSVAGGTNILSSKTSNNHAFWIDNNSGGKLAAGHNPYTQVIDSALFPLNSWQHVAVTYDGSSVMRLYRNGVEVNNASGIPAISGVGTAEIGAFQNGNLWNGLIDDVRVYNRALSPSEVSRLYDWAPGPVAHWKLDERTGTSAFDSSGNANTGTLTNGPQWATGKFGQALQFDGVDDEVTLPAIMPTGAYTKAAWVYKTTTGIGNNIISAPGAGLHALWSSGFDSGKLASGHNYPTSDQVKDTIPLPTNSWQHAAVTYDGSSVMRLYRNGIEVASATGISPNTDATVGIGEYFNGNRWVGTIDDVRLYNYALTGKQIVSVMNADHPAVGSPVGSALGHWKFDEGYGTTANNAGANGSSLNGTLSGTGLPLWKNEGKFGKALYLNGSSSYLDMGNPTAAQITSDLTLSSWVYLSSNTANQDIIAKRGLSSQWGYRLWVDSTGTPKIDVSSTGNVMATASASQTLARNQWYHLLGTYSASQSAITIYVNGVQQGQTTASVPTSLQNSTANLNIGREAGAETPNYLNASLDEVKLYNYALSSDEVKVEYNQGKAVVLGSLSTDPDGVTASNSANRAYCVPGDTTTCNPPVAHWTLDERTGTTTNDITGNDNPGTLTNGPQWVTGKLGQALSFDGANDYVGAGPDSILDFGTSQDFSVTAWIKTTDTASTKTVVSKQFTGGSNPGFFFQVDGNVVYAQVRDATTIAQVNDAVHPIADGTWHFVAMTADRTGLLSLYSDGTLDGTPVDMTAVGDINNVESLFIGKRKVQEWFLGNIDDVRVYNYVRTPAQIAWDYNRGGPVGWWRFDECTGTTAYDASGQGNNGTITIGGTGSQTSVGNCTTVDTLTAWYNGKDGKYNSSLSLDGTNDYVDVNQSSTLKPTAGVTAAGWFSRTGSFVNYSAVFSSPHTASDCGGYLLTGLASGKLRMYIDQPGTCSWTSTDSTTIPAANTWYHVAGTWDGSNIRIYVNGVLENTTSATTIGYGTITKNAQIGGYQDNAGDPQNSFPGLLDDVRVYNYALTATQIRLLYNENAAIRFGPLTGSP